MEYGSSVSSELDDVSPSVVGSPGGSSLGIEMSLNSQTSAGFTCWGDSSVFSVFLVGSSNPVDSGIISDAVMSWVDHDDLEVFVGSVLSNPIAVQYSETSQSSANSFLGLWPEVSGGLELINTNRGWLSSDDSLGDRSLSSTSSDSNSVDDVALFGLEAEFASFVGSGWLVDSVDDWQLPVLPGPDTENEVHQVRLFLPPELFEIFVGAHGMWW